MRNVATLSSPEALMQDRASPLNYVFETFDPVQAVGPRLRHPAIELASVCGVGQSSRQEFAVTGEAGVDLARGVIEFRVHGANPECAMTRRLHIPPSGHRGLAKDAVLWNGRILQGTPSENWTGKPQ